MFKKISLPSLLLTSVLLSACSSTPTPQNRYDVGIGDLSLPPDLTQISPPDRFRVPNSSWSPTTVLPAGVKSNEEAWIEQSDSTPISYWLVLKQGPHDLWSRLETFLSGYNAPVMTNKVELGILDTDWVPDQTKQGGLIRYRVRVDSRPQRVEIYGIVQRIDQQGRFSVDQDESIVFIRQMGNSLLGERQDQQWPIKPSSYPKDSTKKLPANTQQMSGNMSSISVPGGFDAVWRKIDVALSKTAFTVESRQKEERYFLVRYIDPASLQGGKNDKETLKKLFSVEGGVGVRYRITLKPASDKINQIDVNVEDATGRAISATQKMEILQTLVPFLY
jgi:uncharacterized lipoprotein